MVSITHPAFTSRPPAAAGMPAIRLCRWSQRLMGSPIRANSLIEALGLVICQTRSIVTPATVFFIPIDDGISS